MLVEELKNQAHVAFNCKPTYTYSGNKRTKKRSKRQQRVDMTIDKFVEAMSSDSPPKTEQELIQKVSVEFSWLMWFLFKTLITEVLKWCWKRTR
jgi:hypothetical protein